MQIRTIEDITASNIPTNVLLDIIQRINDWLASGGHFNDAYIHQQIAYANRIQQSFDAFGCAE